MSKKIIIANWKNHPESLGQAKEILESIGNYLGNLEEQSFSLIICPPFVFTEEVAKVLESTSLGSRVSLGAQDIAPDDETALTGEVSGAMLKKLNVRYAIVGHSERRWKLGESDEIVNRKLKAVLRNEMIPVVCVGERERNGGYKEFLKNQIETTFAGLAADDVSKCIIAYEPVWAISTNPDAKPDNPEETIKIFDFIKDTLIENWNFQSEAGTFALKIENLPKILYGGSVTDKNSQDFLSHREINGILVGGASVRKEEFISILAKVA